MLTQEIQNKNKSKRANRESEIYLDNFKVLT